MVDVNWSTSYNGAHALWCPINHHKSEHRSSLVEFNILHKWNLIFFFDQSFYIDGPLYNKGSECSI